MSDELNQGPWWEPFAIALVLVATICIGALAVAATIGAIRWLV